MSSLLNIEYGYGIDKETLRKITTKNMEEFLKNHLPLDYKEMVEDVASEIGERLPEESDYEQWMEECTCINSGINGMYSIISTVMTRETGIRFTFHNDTDATICAIMLSKSLPWEMNKYEARCTKEHVEYLFKKYLSELDLQEDQIVFKNISVEYYN